MSTVNPSLTRQYGMSIYLYGTRKFTDIPVHYHAPIKGWAAQNLTLAQLDEAYTNGFINEQEYQETLALRVA